MQDKEIVVDVIIALSDSKTETRGTGGEIFLDEITLLYYSIDLSGN
jgi:hypothetical protein